MMKIHHYVVTCKFLKTGMDKN